MIRSVIATCCVCIGLFVSPLFAMEGFTNVAGWSYMCWHDSMDDRPYGLMIPAEKVIETNNASGAVVTALTIRKTQDGEAIGVGEEGSVDLRVPVQIRVDRNKVWEQRGESVFGFEDSAKIISEMAAGSKAVIRYREFGDGIVETSFDLSGFSEAHAEMQKNFDKNGP